MLFEKKKAKGSNVGNELPGTEGYVASSWYHGNLERPAVKELPRFPLHLVMKRETLTLLFGIDMFSCARTNPHVRITGKSDRLSQ
jgi:hypothetical protein